MFKLNENYLKLPGSYLFSTIAKKVAAFQESHPDREIIRLGIGDVTQPDVKTHAGYYDPEEDKRNGEEDRYTGWWYVNI